MYAHSGTFVAITAGHPQEQGILSRLLEIETASMIDLALSTA